MFVLFAFVITSIIKNQRVIFQTCPSLLPFSRLIRIILLNEPIFVSDLSIIVDILRSLAALKYSISL